MKKQKMICAVVGWLFLATFITTDKIAVADMSNIYDDWSLDKGRSTIKETTILSPGKLVFGNRDCKYGDIPEGFIGARITRGMVDFKKRNIFVFTDLPEEFRMYFMTHSRHVGGSQIIPVEVIVVRTDGKKNIYSMKDMTDSKKKISYVLKGPRRAVTARARVFYMDLQNVKELEVNAGSIAGNIFFTLKPKEDIIALLSKPKFKKTAKSYHPRIYMDTTGKDIQAIVITDEPIGITEWAAEELQRYLKRITEVELPIMRESEASDKKPAILVGMSTLARVQGIDEKIFKPEGFILKTTSDYVIIAGDDHPAWEADLFREDIEIATLIDIERMAGPRKGTLYGIYTFLEKVCGVGWFFPGPLGEVVPQGIDIAIPNLNKIEVPDFSIRRSSISLTETGEINLPEYQGKFYQEMRKHFPVHMRLQYIDKYRANHSMICWGKLFGKEHPEYFALVDGERTNDWDWGDGKGRSGGVHRSFCWANPATIAQQIEEMRLFFSSSEDWHDRSPWRTTSRYAYPIGMNDGRQNTKTDRKNLPICECEYCMKWHMPDRPYRGSMSDLYAYHLSKVAKVAAKEFPDRYIIGMTYGANVLLPVKVKFPPNVTMGLASVGNFIFTHYHPQTKEWYDSWVASWMDKVNVTVIWLYLERLRSQWDHLPLVIVHALGEEIKSRKGQIDGFLIQGGRSDFFTALELYVATQLMWDADQDIEEVIDRYMSKLYGPAAGTVKELYYYLENLWAKEMRIYNPGPDPTGLPIPNWKIYPRERLVKVFTPKKLEKALLLMDEAMAMVPKVGKRILTKGNEPMKRAERLKRLKESLMLAYADSVLENSR